jgi:hypothetical protein
VRKTVRAGKRKVLVRWPEEDAAVFRFSGPGTHGTFADLNTGRVCRRYGRRSLHAAEMGEGGVDVAEVGLGPKPRRVLQREERLAAVQAPGPEAAADLVVAAGGGDPPRRRKGER